MPRNEGSLMGDCVFLTRPVPEAGLARLRTHCEVDIRAEHLPPSRDELIARLQGAAGLLCHVTDTIDESVLKAAPALRVISNFAVGVNNIDVAAATRLGIAVGNTPDVLTDATADLAFALLI